MKHDFKKGDVVWWTVDQQTPLPFSKEKPFIGIVVDTSKTHGEVEVYWFNNTIFKALNHKNLMLAKS
jgi:hypothetical protein|tara:strand:+ start:234 stop:434 length:201 start_codon:yes stop_codon:yes gene_type:complete